MRIVIVFVALFLLACMGGGIPTSAPAYVPQPNIVVGEAHVAVCGAGGGLFSDCVRVECSMLNAGDAQGTSTVRLDVVDASGKSHQYSQLVTLEAGERTSVSHDFKGADDDGTSYGSCAPQ